MASFVSGSVSPPFTGSSENRLTRAGGNFGYEILPWRIKNKVILKSTEKSLDKNKMMIDIKWPTMTLCKAVTVFPNCFGNSSWRLDNYTPFVGVRSHGCQDVEDRCWDLIESTTGAEIFEFTPYLPLSPYHLLILGLLHGIGLVQRCKPVSFRPSTATTEVWWRCWKGTRKRPHGRDLEPSAKLFG